MGAHLLILFLSLLCGALGEHGLLDFKTLLCLAGFLGLVLRAYAVAVLYHTLIM